MVLPMETGLANPEEVIVATLGTLEVKLAIEVTFWKVPSEKVAVTVYCTVWLCDSDIVMFCGLRVRAVTVLLLTVSDAVAVTLLVDLAVMVAVPSATPVANPEVSMVAIVGADEIQVTCEVTSPVLLLPKVAVALNCCVACGITNVPVGETARETMVSLDGKKPEQLVRRMATRHATTHRQKMLSLRLQFIYPTPQSKRPSLAAIGRRSLSTYFTPRGQSYGSDGAEQGRLAKAPGNERQHTTP